MAKGKGKTNEPEIVNRKARHDYTIDRTLEVGIVLQGSEVKSIRAAQASLAEGYVRAEAAPARLTLHSVHINEYPPAAGVNQHEPTRTRRLLAHKREIIKLATDTLSKGVTIVPLKMYFKDGRVKLLIGVGTGKKKGDRREDMREREAKRDIERAMSKKMR
ncbi:MAG: SsrA-binding protein SmpB [Phycisphaeraceae bacterium]|nr:MAG: SsrA-binding protein SmpB [Phycisphaeraceae bacterium]